MHWVFRQNKENQFYNKDMYHIVFSENLARKKKKTTIVFFQIYFNKNKPSSYLVVCVVGVKNLLKLEINW